ncbi:MAG: NADPH-dependent F420 reductase [Dehalococcoidia bacterium]
MPHTIALIGGTGPEGRGLATRFALAGHRVILGSRDAARGEAAAAELAAALPRGQVEGGDNASAVSEAEVAILVVPYAAHRSTLEELRDALAGKIVVDAVVPMEFDRGPRWVEVEAGSAAEEAVEVLGDSARIVAAFHNLAASELLDPAARIDADVLVVGRDEDAKKTVVALANDIEGVRGVDAGPIRFARHVEGLTILLAGINMWYKTHSAVRIVNLDVTTAPR